MCQLLGTLHACFAFIFVTTPHFIDQETKAQGGQLTFLAPYNEQCWHQDLVPTFFSVVPPLPVVPGQLPREHRQMGRREGRGLPDL